MSHEIAQEAGVVGREAAAARPEKQEGASMREYIESLLVTVVLAVNLVVDTLNIVLDPRVAEQ